MLSLIVLELAQRFHVNVVQFAVRDFLILSVEICAHQRKTRRRKRKIRVEL
jgi:hypothetical protein